MDLATVIELLGQAKVVEFTEIPSASRDVKDDKFLATAEAAHAAYLVTEDQDLLVLKEYKGVKIITAATFQRILEEGEA